MLKFKTSCAVLAYLSSNLLNEVGLSLFRYFEVGLRVCDIVVKKFTFAISSPDEFLFLLILNGQRGAPISQPEHAIICCIHIHSPDDVIKLYVTENTIIHKFATFYWCALGALSENTK